MKNERRNQFLDNLQDIFSKNFGAVTKRKQKKLDKIKAYLAKSKIGRELLDFAFGGVFG